MKQVRDVAGKCTSCIDQLTVLVGLSLTAMYIIKQCNVNLAQVRHQQKQRDTNLVHVRHQQKQCDTNLVHVRHQLKQCDTNMVDA